MIIYSLVHNWKAGAFKPYPTYTEKSTLLHYQSLLPLSSLASRWGLDWYWSFPDFVPIRAERSATTLLEALHHCSFGVIIGIREQILEELV